MKHKKKCGWLLILPNLSHNFQMIVRVSIEKTQECFEKLKELGKNSRILAKKLNEPG